VGDSDRGHLASCADCQAYARGSVELDSELRREALALRRTAPAPSAGLARSIQQAVRRERAAAPAPARLRFPLWASGSLAAAAAVAFAVYFQRPSDTPTPAATAVALVDAVGNFSARFNETLIPATGAMVANNPLQHELGSVYSDARSALNFLALNFLPTAPAPVSAAPTPAASTSRI